MAFFYVFSSGSIFFCQQKMMCSESVFQLALSIDIQSLACVHVSRFACDIRCHALYKSSACTGWHDIFTGCCVAWSQVQQALRRKWVRYKTTRGGRHANACPSYRSSSMRFSATDVSRSIMATCTRQDYVRVCWYTDVVFGCVFSRMVYQTKLHWDR